MNQSWSAAFHRADHVTPDMSIYTYEILRTVLFTILTHDYSEALQLLLEHKYGNNVVILTRDSSTARDCVARVQLSMVSINVTRSVPVA
ncbi:aldehyde dehydrogenase family protein [Mycobacterium lepromatosis]|uniref:aldehyde dehydrogenase family protein n=1 Tax=Mycobacterium lepromatosis TaxID=480418 RepID=UPI001ED9A5BB|nr:aldehyde dehydrogenase family protein [Mycobacterium lepromatosis]